MTGVRTATACLIALLLALVVGAWAVLAVLLLAVVVAGMAGAQAVGSRVRPLARRHPGAGDRQPTTYDPAVPAHLAE